MSLTPSNHTLCKQFEIWQIPPNPASTQPFYFILIVSKVDTLAFHKEPGILAVPLFQIQFLDALQAATPQVHLPFIRGGANSMSGLPEDMVVDTASIFPIRKINLRKKISFASDAIINQVQTQLKERLGF